MSQDPVWCAGCGHHQVLPKYGRTLCKGCRDKNAESSGPPHRPTREPVKAADISDQVALRDQIRKDASGMTEEARWAALEAYLETALQLLYAGRYQLPAERGWRLNDPWRAACVSITPA
jgi:hypothetical protein